jgi:cell fate regulator YaaT (PSP1 superfamily)
MGCGSCGTTTKDGKPSGCKSNGGCSTGGCNRMNVHNWLNDLPVSDIGKPYPIIEVSFNHGSRKDFYKNNTVHFYEKGDFLAVEGTGGFDVGTVSLTGELVKLQMAKRGIKEDSEEVKKVLRLATAEDVAKLDEAKAKEKTMLIRSRAAIHILNLDMKLTEVEMQADSKKATFYYIAEDRVDYRELIKMYANDYKIKVEMKQIGIRQEAAKVGGIGSCGRELCCSTWLTDFKGVSTVAARYQNLSINQTKLSGQCGRLKCCLNFELDTYMDALKGFPENADKLELAKGVAYLQKKDIFKNVMWYTLAGSNKQYPLMPERVLEIQALNAKGQKPEELGFVEIESKKPAVAEEAYVDLVGAISLKSLDKANKKNKHSSSKPRPNTNMRAPAGSEGVTPRSNAPRPNPNQNRENRPPRPNQARPTDGPVTPKQAPQIMATKPAPNPNVLKTNGDNIAPKPSAPRPANPNQARTINPNAPKNAEGKPNTPRPPNPNQARPQNLNAQNGADGKASEPRAANTNPHANNGAKPGGTKFKSDFGGKKPPKDKPTDKPAE